MLFSGAEMSGTRSTKLLGSRSCSQGCSLFSIVAIALRTLERQTFTWWSITPFFVAKRLYDGCDGNGSHGAALGTVVRGVFSWGRGCAIARMPPDRAILCVISDHAT